MYKGKIKKISALIISATIMIGTMGSLAACGKGSDKDSVRDTSERATNKIEISSDNNLSVADSESSATRDSSASTSGKTTRITTEITTIITHDDGSTEVVVTDNTGMTEKTTGTTTETTTRSTTRESTTERTSEITTRSTTEYTTEYTTEATTRATTRETTTESTTESTTEATTRATTRETTTESTTESTTEKTTEKPTEAPTEAPVCSHLWVWKTHTEEVWVDPVTHQEPVYDEGWTEYFYVDKVYCGACHKYYDSIEDYQNNDYCYGGWSIKKVLDHTVEHEPEILYWDTITDVPGHYEEIEVKDYQYCSKCGVRK